MQNFDVYLYTYVRRRELHVWFSQSFIRSIDNLNSGSELINPINSAHTRRIFIRACKPVSRELRYFTQKYS